MLVMVMTVMVVMMVVVIVSMTGTVIVALGIRIPVQALMHGVFRHGAEEGMSPTQGENVTGFSEGALDVVRHHHDPASVFPVYVSDGGVHFVSGIGIQSRHRFI